MGPRKWSAALVLVVCLGGCRNQARYELLERDLRLHEDEIYHLEDELAAMQSRLDSARHENAALRRELSERQGGSGTSSGGRSELEPAELPSVELGGDAIDGGTLGEQAPPYSGPPVIDPLPPEDDSYPGQPQPAFPPGDEPPEFVPPGGEVNPTSASAALGLDRLLGQRPPEAIQDYFVKQITLHKLLTGGYNTDGRLGDEGLLVVVEPRNAAGQVLNVAGDLSLVLLDPALSGDAARVARWDFTADELAEQFRSNVFGAGVRLELPWPGSPPTHGQLQLFARWTTPEGDQHEAERAIRVELPPQPSGQWQHVIVDSGPQLVEPQGASPAPREPDRLPRSAQVPGSRRYRPRR